MVRVLREMTNVKTRSKSDSLQKTEAKPNVLPLESKADSKNLVREKKKKVVPVKVEPAARKREENVNYKRNKIIASDLTNNEPGERYWEVIAEKRRIALKETTEENALLHKTIDLLTKENETLKQALSEATAAIEVFNEIIAEHEESQSPEGKIAST